MGSKNMYIKFMNFIYWTQDMKKQHTDTFDPVFTSILTLNPIDRCPIPKTWNLYAAN